MLDKLKTKKADYEKVILDYEGRIADCNNKINEYEKGIDGVKAKMALIDEMIAEEESRAIVEVKQEDQAESVCVADEAEEEAEAEVVEDAVEEKPNTIIFHYGCGSVKTPSVESQKD